MALGKGARSSSSNLQGLRVLVVEDGWQVADALKLSLERMGMVVAGPAATAREAQCLATECPPDLAVVDVNLKGEMAYELMDWLHDRSIRVVVIYRLRRPSWVIGEIRSHPAQAVHRYDATDNPAAGDGAESDTVMGFVACVSLRMHLDGSSILQRRPSASKVRSTVPPSS